MMDAEIYIAAASGHVVSIRDAGRPAQGGLEGMQWPLFVKITVADLPDRLAVLSQDSPVYFDIGQLSQQQLADLSESDEAAVSALDYETILGTSQLDLSNVLDVSGRVAEASAYQNLMTAIHQRDALLSTPDRIEAAAQHSRDAAYRQAQLNLAAQLRAELTPAVATLNAQVVQARAAHQAQKSANLRIARK